MERNGVRGGGAEVRRAMLFASTALCAVVVGLPARAQTIDPTTTPTGGVVVGGSSTIIQAPGATTINQSSERTAINWQSFNVGSNAQVTFNQPNAQAIALNRVTGGNLSIINGRIDANGQVVLVNQSGVVFAKGSQVNAENIVVSTADISPANFMAGKMVFDGAPNPGAQIINEGHLTAKQAGLVGLVAPQVSNSGVITARLGTVILAGASTFTLDLYGDKLISLDVTQAVRGIDVGGKILPALVTNSGLIIADGGKVTLTAQDADALVTQLISAGGTIQANSTSGQAGQILLAGVGGNIAISGNLLARGVAADAHGGAIQAITTGTVALTPTAVVDASGPAGGGNIAIGTDIARAVQGPADVAAPKAAAVTVAAGAVVRADATGRGNGGKIVLLSTHETDFQGAISVRGGATAGNGGAAEISSDGVISLGGTVLATAINGQAGEILLDPNILYIGGTNGPLDPGTSISPGNTQFGGFGTVVGTSHVDAAELDLLGGHVTLEAIQLISVVSAVDMQLATALSLISHGDISISAAITVNGSLEIDASNSLVIDAPLNAKNILLSSGTSGTAIDAPITAGTLISLAGLGTFAEGSFVSGGTIPTTLIGALTAPTLAGAGTIGGDVLLTNNNAVGTLGGITLASGGELDLLNTVALTAAGTVSTGTLVLGAPSLAITGVLNAATSATLDVSGGVSESGGINTPLLTGSFGGADLLTGNNSISTLQGLFGGTQLVLDDTANLTIESYLYGTAITLSAPSIAIDGAINSSELALQSTGNVSEAGAGAVQVTTLDSGGGTIGGDVLLTGNNNTISTLAGFTVASGHTLSLVDQGPLSVTGPVVAPVITLSADLIQIPGSISATLLALESDGISGAGNISATTLTSGGTTIGGSVSLTGTGNSITNIGDFILDGNLFLADASGLTVIGTVAAPNGEIDLSGTTLAEAAGGSLRAATLAGNFTGGATLGRSNTFGALAGFTAASALLADTEALNLAGQLNIAGSAVLNDSGGGVSEQAGGTITAGTLGGTINGDLSLTNVSTIGMLDGLTLGALNTLSLDDAAILSLGDVAAGDASLTAAGFVLTGVVNIGDQLALAAGGDITQTGGLLRAATLTSNGNAIGGNVLLSAANSVASVAAFDTAGRFELNDAVSLDIVGVLGGQDVTLAAPTLGLNGEIVAGSTQTPGTLAIATDQFNIGPFFINQVLLNSAIIVPFGTIAIAPFTDGKAIDIGGSNAGDLAILPTLISIIDTFRAPADIIIGQADGRQASTETIDNSISIGSGVLDLDPSGTITDHGTLAARTLAFSGGGFNQSAGGALQAFGLRGDGAPITGAVKLGSTLNAITGLGSLSVTNADFLLATGDDMFITGPVTANDVVLESLQGLTLEGGISAATGGTIDLVADTINSFGAASLQAVDGRVAIAPYDRLDVDFGSYNGGLHIDGGIGTLVTAQVLQIGSADGFTGGVLDVNGPLTISTPTLALNGTAIAFTGSLTEPGLVTFDSAGDVAQTSNQGTGAPVLIAGTVSGTGGTILLGGANSISILGSLISGTDIGVNNAIALSIAGLLQAPGTVSLGDSGGNITETTGLIDAGTLNTGGTAIAGDLVLANNNSIGNFGGISIAAGHSLDITDGEFVTLSGPVSAPRATLNLAGMQIAGTIAGTLLALSGAGPVSETGGGAVDEGSLISLGTIAGDVRLTGANTIATLGSFAVAAGDTLALFDTGLLTAAGPVLGSVVTLSAATMALTGDINATLLALESSGNVTQSGGTVMAATLTTGGTTIGGNLRLGDANNIGTLGGAAVANTLALNDTGTLVVAGPVTAPVATLAASAITITGTVDDSNNLALESSGDVREQGGIITAGTLTSGGGTIGGAVSLGSANTIGLVGGLAALGNILLRDAGNLNIGGVVSTPGTFSVESGGNVAEVTGGIIDAAAFDSGGTTIGGSAALTNGNSIVTLGNFALNGNFNLNDLAGLTIAGLLDPPGIVTITDPVSITETTGSIDAGTLNATGPAGAILLGNANSVNVVGTLQAGGRILFNDALDLVIAGLISTPGEASLEDAGAISEAGRISAGTLDSGGTAIGGDVALNGANTITSLGGFTVAGAHALALHDTGGLDVTGPVLAGSASLSAAAITVAGNLDIANELALVSAAGITETTGAITAGTLDSGGATEGGDVALNNANHIGTLGGFDASGGLALNDLTPLFIAAPVSLGGVLALLDTGAITQTGGSISAAGLSSDGGTIGGAVALLQAGNVIPTLGVFAAPAGFALADNGPLALTGDIFTGTNTLNLRVNNGAITQTAGAITAGTVAASAADISLAGANAIFRLGAVNTGNLLAHGVAGLSGPLVASGSATITSPGNFTIDGPARVADDLFIGAAGAINQNPNTGPVTAQNATYDAGTAISLAGTTNIGGVLDLIATGNIIHNAGLLNAGTLTGSAGTLASFTGPTNVATLGSFLLQDSLFVLHDDSALVISGPVKASAMSISAVGLLTLQGTPDGGLFFTGGIAPNDTTKPRPQDSMLTVTKGPGNAAPRLVQTGVFYINAGPNAKTLLAGKGAAATIFINTTPNGSISFAPAPPTTAGLDGPTVDVVIAAGTGTVTGNVNLKQVVIVSAGKVDLTGFLNNVGGPSGAGNGVVTPFPDPNFQFNACPIGSVNCTILPIESLPAADPLQNFEIDQHKKRKLNHNVQLPGIATRDF